MPGIAGAFSADPEAAIRSKGLVASLTLPLEGVLGFRSDIANGVHVGWALHGAGAQGAAWVWDASSTVAAVVSGEVHADAPHAASSGATVLKAYADHGDRFLEQLDGSFAGLIVDTRRGAALLFNDRFGAGRIYVHEQAGGLYFASEAKALLHQFPHTRRLDPTAVAQTITLGCVMRGRTLFEGISLLPPGSLWIAERSGRILRRTWFDPAQWDSQPPLPDAEFFDALRSTFASSLPRYLTDQPAVSLTGGLDSRMIMAWARPAPGQLPCYSFSGPFRDCHDVRLARRIAHLCGQTHRTIAVGREMLEQFPALAARCVEVSDGTMDVSGAVELYVNRIARDVSAVRLTGNYGSEIVRGNVAFRPRRIRPGLYAAELDPLFDAAAQTYREERAVSDLHFVAFKQVPWHHHARLSVEQSVLTMRSPFLDRRLVALMFRSSAAMRANVDTSLRLIHAGHAALGSLPTDRALSHGRQPPFGRLRHAMREFSARAEYAYDYGMPAWLARTDHALRDLHLERLFLGRHKFYHFRLWYRDALAGFVRETLLSPSASAQQWFQPGQLRRLVEEHVSGHANNTLELHRALTLELVSSRLLRAPAGS